MAITPSRRRLRQAWQVGGAKAGGPVMASNSRQLSRFLARTAGQAQFAAVVFAGAVAFASVAAAANPSEVAVVESISGNSSGVEFMDYLHLGQVIRLSPRETLVLSYKASCVRE